MQLSQGFLARGLSKGCKEAMDHGSDHFKACLGKGHPRSCTQGLGPYWQLVRSRSFLPHGVSIGQLTTW